MTAQHYGATEGEWAHFDLVLGLGPDLLPVVSNPHAVISPQSKMKALGKVPSRYNGQRQAAGIASWTSHVATAAEIAKWSSDSDLGICIQTRNVRAIDVDIDDTDQALAIAVEINKHLPEAVALPRRYREDATKFLLAFTLSGDYAKRVIKTAHGIVEFLATGQQFVAVGTHPSGRRYGWEGGLPGEIPALTPEQFEAVWTELERRFATEPSTTSKTSSKTAKLADAAANDPTAAALSERALVKSTQPDGRINIVCPFESEHERESDDTATTYFPAFTGGYERGHFKCLHSPCEGRSDANFLAAIGIVEDHRDDFSAVTVPEPSTIVPKDSARYILIPAMEFKAGVPPAWHIKQVLPHAELIVVYGEPGSGKSFYTFDMVAAVARGIPWRGHKTKRGRVVYVVAEGASGFRNRINAYCAVHGVSELDLYVLAAAPNFMEAKDIIDLTNAIRTLGKVSIVVVDTLARVSAGANENSGEDMGRVLGHCSTIHQVTGATILLVHHSGKDASKGARGWSGIKGAVDAEMEITREEANRTAKVSKIKDGEGEGEQYGFMLKTVSVGMDEDGDDVSSCVVEHGAVVAPREKAKRLGRRMETVWQAVLDMQQPDNLGAYEKDVVDAYEASTPKPAGRDQRRPHALAAIDSLSSLGRCKRVAPDRVVLTTQEE